MPSHQSHRARGNLYPFFLQFSPSHHLPRLFVYFLSFPSFRLGSSKGQNKTKNTYHTSGFSSSESLDEPKSLKMSSFIASALFVAHKDSKTFSLVAWDTP